MKLFQNRVLRKIFGPKRNKVCHNGMARPQNEMGWACGTYG